MATSPMTVVAVVSTPDANGNYALVVTDAVLDPSSPTGTVTMAVAPTATVILNEAPSTFGAILVNDTVQFSGNPAVKVKITR